MRIMTCNLRYAGANDGSNQWRYRAQACLKVIQSRQPDILCLQEMWPEQRHDLQVAFPEFADYGMAESATGRHALNTIFYQRDRFRMISASGYWLSETPHVPGSKSWDSTYARFANWIRLETIESSWEFRVVNTHLDHLGQIAREQQAKLINDDAAAYPPTFPQILTGDMNANLQNPAIQLLKRAGWQDTCEPILAEHHDVSTFNGFGQVTPQTSLGRIDWIFTRGPLQPTYAEIIQEKPDGQYPSDHWFVLADVELML